jgi:hypothetical protein
LICIPTQVCCLTVVCNKAFTGFQQSAVTSWVALVQVIDRTTVRKGPVLEAKMWELDTDVRTKPLLVVRLPEKWRRGGKRAVLVRAAQTRNHKLGAFNKETDCGITEIWDHVSSTAGSF